jgi:opacity protein-like surface antigen
LPQGFAKKCIKTIVTDVSSFRHSSFTPPRSEQEMPRACLRRSSMKAVLIVATLALAAAPSYAQGSSVYASIAAGFAVAPDGTSGDLRGQVGVRVAPHLFVFGDFGQFHNLQPSELQPSVDSVDATLAASGLTVTGVAHVPAWYSMGGLRWSMPLNAHLSPYVFGGVGFARLSPAAHFTYQDGTLLGATTAPVAGDDVTAQLVSTGEFVQPAASTAGMFSVGGGVEAPIAPHVVADIGYRVSRVAADTPLTAQSVTFGVGYRF